jgi:hypothetical protein
MALAMLAEIPGLTRQQYESVVEAVNQAGSPAGALFHAGGPTDGGGLADPRGRRGLLRL